MIIFDFYTKKKGRREKMWIFSDYKALFFLSIKMRRVGERQTPLVKQPGLLFKLELPYTIKNSENSLDDGCRWVIFKKYLKDYYLLGKK